MRFEPRHAFHGSQKPARGQSRSHGTPDFPPEIAFLRGFDIKVGDLRAAADTARRESVCAARALMAAGGIGASQYYRALAFELDVPFVADWPALEGPIDPRAVHQTGCVRLACGSDVHWLVAPQDQTLRALPGAKTLGMPDLAITTPAHLAALVRDQAEATIQDLATEALPRNTPRLSAKGACGAGVGLATILASLVGVWGLAYVPRLVGDLFGLLFLIGTSFRMVVGAEGLSAKVPVNPIRALSDAELPTYTILVALRDEADMVPGLLGALERIDYPRSKLEALMIVEPEDLSTRLALASARMPPWVQVVVGPRDRRLRTKPRALNVGLLEARGTLLTVYDAEDRPEPDQLRRAALAFAEDPDLDCVQAQLAIDNGGDSWLARLFAIEYAGLFDLFNIGMTRLRLPLPLGGSSNHFQIAILRAAGGWDAWNVTEDADLGIRLARLGCRVESLASTTKETAPDAIGVWMRQRRRWMKGWLQTFLVLIHDGPNVIRQLGGKQSAALGLIFVNLVIGPLLFPFFCVYVAWRFSTAGLPTSCNAIQIGEATLEVSVLLLGYVSILWFGYVGLRKRRLLQFLPSLLLMPLYLLMISAAAWMSVVDLVRRPYHWHKTEHRAVDPKRETRRWTWPRLLSARIWTPRD